MSRPLVAGSLWRAHLDGRHNTVVVVRCHLHCSRVAKVEARLPVSGRSLGTLIYIAFGSGADVESGGSARLTDLG